MNSLILLAGTVSEAAKKSSETTTALIELAKIIIPIITLIIGYYLGIRKDKSAARSNFYLKCIECFYTPFFVIAYAYDDRYRFQLSQAEDDIKESTIGLIRNNLTCMSPETQRYAFKFLDCVKNLNTDAEESVSEDTFNEIFTCFFNTALIEYKDICKKLGMPIPDLEVFQYYTC